MIKLSLTFLLLLFIVLGCHHNNGNTTFLEDSLLLRINQPLGDGEQLNNVLSKYRIDFIHVGLFEEDSVAIQVKDVLVDYNGLRKFMLQQIDNFDSERQHFFCLNLDRNISNDVVVKIKQELSILDIKEIYISLSSGEKIAMKKETL